MTPASQITVGGETWEIYRISDGKAVSVYENTLQKLQGLITAAITTIPPKTTAITIEGFKNRAGQVTPFDAAASRTLPTTFNKTQYGFAADATITQKVAMERFFGIVSTKVLQSSEDSDYGIRPEGEDDTGSSATTPYDRTTVEVSSAASSDDDEIAGSRDRGRQSGAAAESEAGVGTGDDSSSGGVVTARGLDGYTTDASSALSAPAPVEAVPPSSDDEDNPGGLVRRRRRRASDIGAGVGTSDESGGGGGGGVTAKGLDVGGGAAAAAVSPAPAQTKPQASPATLKSDPFAWMRQELSKNNADFWRQIDVIRGRPVSGNAQGKTP